MKKRITINEAKERGITEEERKENNIRVWREMRGRLEKAKKHEEKVKIINSMYK